VQNAQWEESSACPAGAGSGAAARASVGQRSPSKPAAACAAHSAPTTPDSKALMMSAYATRQPTRLRHRGLSLAGLRCMKSPGTQNSARAILAQAEFCSLDADATGQAYKAAAGIIGHILDFPVAGSLAGTFFKNRRSFGGGESS
jgi:hypothetical protein